MINSRPLTPDVTMPSNPFAVFKPIRLGFVVHAMQVAGAEVLVMETIRRLAGRIVPTVFCLDALGELGARLQMEGVEVICLGRRPGRDLPLAWRFARALRNRRIEVLHAHQYTPFFYSALAKVLARGSTRVIFTEHGRHYPDTVGPLRRAVNRLFLDRLADAVTAVCRFSARSLTKVDGFSGRRIQVIENGIEIERYSSASDRQALRQRLGLDPQRRYLVNVARCHPVKDQATLLRAFRVVAEAVADADLLLVGDGALRKQLEILAGSLGIAERVRFLGIRHDVPDILRSADIFALTSLSEAASLTLLEAMAAQLPVVVTAVGGNPEIVRHGSEGLLAPRGDAPAIADAVLSLLREPATAKALGIAGAQRVRQWYGLERTIERYYALYAGLAGRA